MLHFLSECMGASLNICDRLDFQNTIKTTFIQKHPNAMIQSIWVVSVMQTALLYNINSYLINEVIILLCNMINSSNNFFT